MGMIVAASKILKFIAGAVSLAIDKSGLSLGISKGNKVERKPALCNSFADKVKIKRYNRF